MIVEKPTAKAIIFSEKKMIIIKKQTRSNRSRRPYSANPDFRAFFFSGIRNLLRDVLSQMKLRVANTPPARTKRAVNGSKRIRQMRAIRKERTRISQGIRCRILSSKEGGGPLFSLSALFILILAEPS